MGQGIKTEGRARRRRAATPREEAEEIKNRQDERKTSRDKENRPKISIEEDVGSVDEPYILNEEDTPSRRHRGLPARTDRHEANEHAALVTKERPRIEDDKSSEDGSRLYRNEEDVIGSDCSSDGKFAPEDHPQPSYG